MDPHYNDLDFGGIWRGVALRSVTGSPTDLTAAPSFETRFIETPVLERCPYFQEVLSNFKCNLKSVRLLSLAPDSFIREHCDKALDFENGEIRLHIPVQTSSEVEFYVCGERLRMEEARCYYVNVNLPHRVNNRGSADRIHLVIDAEVNDWVRDVLSRSGPISAASSPAGGAVDFRELIFCDNALQKTLGPIADRREFIGATVDAGRKRGFRFHEADVEATFRLAAPHAPKDLTGWLPAKLKIREQAPPLVQWIHAPERRFTEPFFEDSVRRLLRHPLTAFTLCESALPSVSSRPAGFIFHMSRCGSTLISRGLAALDRCFVVSEAPPVDQIIQCAAPDSDRIEWLRNLTGALAGERPLIIKFDAWHIHNFALIHAAFPDTPWVFVYRDPVEVLVSHLRQPGLHMIPPANSELPRAEQCAEVLAGLLSSALAAREAAGGLFVNYTELPDAIGDRIAGHFGLTLSVAERTVLREACLLDAKNPYINFEPDSGDKQESGRPLRDIPGVRSLEALYSKLSGRLRFRKMVNANTPEVNSRETEPGSGTVDVAT